MNAAPSVPPERTSTSIQASFVDWSLRNSVGISSPVTSSTSASMVMGIVAMMSGGMLMLTARQMGDSGEMVSVGERMLMPAPCAPASRFGETGWSERMVTAATAPATWPGSVKAVSLVASAGTTRVVRSVSSMVLRPGMSIAATTISRVGSAVIRSPSPWLLR
jgi:hypothetical protein